jgi:hypothetical protein
MWAHLFNKSGKQWISVITTRHKQNNMQCLSLRKPQQELVFSLRMHFSLNVNINSDVQKTYCQSRQTVVAYTFVRCRGPHTFNTVGSQMTVRLTALGAGCALPLQKKYCY